MDEAKPSCLLTRRSHLSRWSPCCCSFGGQGWGARGRRSHWHPVWSLTVGQAAPKMFSRATSAVVGHCTRGGTAHTVWASSGSGNVSPANTSYTQITPCPHSVDEKAVVRSYKHFPRDTLMECNGVTASPSRLHHCGGRWLCSWRGMLWRGYDSNPEFSISQVYGLIK